jgi:DNA-binding transcriptional MocR family regulator
MMLVQNYITGRTASKVAGDVEAAIFSGALPAGHPMPTIRHLADALGVSPATVAAAYRVLQLRALLVSHGRRGTRVAHRPVAVARRRPVAVSRGLVQLSDGNPDPALLPDSGRALRGLRYREHLYGETIMHAGLLAALRKDMQREGVPSGPCCVVNGTMDGLDRLFSEHLRPGDRIAVEDPGFTGHHDLALSRGLVLAPVRVDAEGMLPDALAETCAERVHAVLVTPRAQSPTGAALTPERARDLRAVLRKHPNVLVIEDDHSSFLCESTPYQPLHDARSRWAHLRSLSKAFNPDLRVGVLTGDEQTVNRILDRLVVVERWVSMLLQSLAHSMVTDSSIRAQVRKAGREYDRRRSAIMAMLQRHGLHPTGSSGFNIWLPVMEETPTVQAMAHAGWAVAPGERFRINSPPGIRFTVSRVHGADSKRLAEAVAAAVQP